MKSFITLVLGFIGLFFMEGFSRLIIAFYHRMEFHFYGISHIESPIWIVLILITILVSTWLITMLILTIINKKSLLHSLIFATMILAWRFIEIINSLGYEPIWYLMTVIFLHLAGIFTAYKLFTTKYETAST